VIVQIGGGRNGQGIPVEPGVARLDAGGVSGLRVGGGDGGCALDIAR
jgi:hypothetical protein